MGKDDYDIPSLYATLHKVMCQHTCGLEDVLVGEVALRRLACSRLDYACSVGVPMRIASKDVVDGALEVRPVKVCCRVWDVCLVHRTHDGVWWGNGVLQWEMLGGVARARAIEMDVCRIVQWEMMMAE
jgi:hypothetical protein